MSTQKHIVAGSAAYDLRDGILHLGKVIRYGLALTGKPTPRLCYLGTADGDNALWIGNFYTACIGESVIASHLSLFSMPNVHDVRTHLLAQDMLWVGGGSVANLLAVWRTHGLDAILRDVWERGIVLTGVSAGAVCWHVGGTTDSFGVDLRPITNGLAFLPYSCGVHYDSEAQRRPLLHKLIGEGTLPDGYATDDGVALHYVDTTMHTAVSQVPGKRAYHVAKTAAGVEETPIDPELL
jgi:peptidase E